MPNGDRPPLRIPSERVGENVLDLSGRSQTFPRDDYREHAGRLRAEFATAKSASLRKSDADIASQVVLQVATPEETKASKFRKNLSDVGLKIVAASHASENAVLASIAREQLAVLEQKVHVYASDEARPYRRNLSVIEHITDVPVEEKVDTQLLAAYDEPTDCLITLYSVFSPTEAVALAERVASNIAEFGFPHEVHQFRDGTVAIAARISPSFIRDLGQKFISIRSVVPNNVLVVPQSTPSDRLPHVVGFEPLDGDAVVGVVDSGINSNSRELRQFVDGYYPNLPQGSVSLDPDHGTFVASRIVYGDTLAEQVQANILEPGCRVVDVPVFGVDARGRLLGLDEFGLAKALDIVVPLLSDSVRVWNLSLGCKTPVTDGRFSFLAYRLDVLAKNEQVLFVVSSGNYQDDFSTYPDYYRGNGARILPPAESALSLSVGSFSKYADASSLSPSGCLSPFSRIGPSADGSLKPDLVAHGGNIGASGATSKATAVVGLHGAGKHLATDVGTSYSAPLVSRCAARLIDRLPNESLNLVKALVVHSAEPRSAPAGFEDSAALMCGYGEPLSDGSVGCPSSSVVYTYTGTLKVGRHQVVPFHVPALLAEDSIGRKLGIKITVACDPPVDYGNQIEYCSARLSLRLLKNYAGFGVASESHKQISIAASPFYGQWTSVAMLHKHVSRRYATGEWHLTVRLLTRGSVPADYEQDYSAVIEVYDAEQGGGIYEAAVQEFGHIYAPISSARAA